MTTFKKGDLVYWVAPSGNKYWAFIDSFNRSKKAPLAYLIAATFAHWVALTCIKPATVNQVIRYNRRVFHKTAVQTRTAMELAKNRKRNKW